MLFRSLILGWEYEELIPGGAANTANNLLALGAEVHPVGLLGDDEHGRALVEHFEERGVSRDGIVLSADYRTVTKTRTLAGSPTRWKSQIVRIDREPEGGIPSGVAQDLLARVRELTRKVDGWIFSERGSGWPTPAPGSASSRAAPP